MGFVPPPHVVYALALILASRMLVFSAGTAALRYLPPDPAEPAMSGTAPWFRWDAPAYRDIATHGYTIADYTSSFPLYPLLAAFTARATGLSISLAMLLVANACFVLAGLVVFNLIRREFDARVGWLAVASMSCFPTTLFLSVGYADSLFLLLSALTFHWLQRGRLWPGALAAGLGAATRPFGGALALSVLVEAWQRRQDAPPRALCRSVLLGVVSLWGLLAYLGYLGVTFGHPLIFLQDYFPAASDGPHGVAAYWPWNILAGALASGGKEAIVNGMSFLGLLLVTAFGARRLPPRYTALSLPVIALVYATAPSYYFLAASRYFASLIPAHVSLAILLSRRPAWAWGALALSAAVAALWTALYVLGYSIR